jgi:hypothetical protein
VLGQFVLYMGISLASYQAYGLPNRRDLSETGPVSLGGLLDFGIRPVLGFRPLTPIDTNPERVLSSVGVPLASATRNVYYDFEADFGREGNILTVILMATISHLIFCCCRRINFSKLSSLVPLIISIMFWAYSHQFSLLMFDFLRWTLVSFVVWDIGIRIFHEVFVGSAKRIKGSTKSKSETTIENDSSSTENHIDRGQ